MFNAYRLYTGSDGESHVERGSVSTDVIIQADTLQLRETDAHASKGLHTAPVPQYILMLSGVVEFTTRVGETFTTYPGDMLLVEDTTGSGHSWRVVGQYSWKRACVVFSPDADTKFIAENF
jgi:quercetin dioxygenase-like cupin family protein